MNLRDGAAVIASSLIVRVYESYPPPAPESDLIAETLIESNGDFALWDVRLPSTGLFVLVVEDVKDTGDWITTVDVIGFIEPYKHYVRELSATESKLVSEWEIALGLEPGTLSSAGIDVPRFVDTSGAPAVGVQVEVNGATPTGLHYFADSAPQSHRLPVPAAGTGANGSALISPPVPGDLTGSTTDGCFAARGLTSWGGTPPFVYRKILPLSCP